ncbi:MAG: hypothetical protein FWD17_04610 [Polyangiaceae bacterium]|nr:hypothetical protein [Polyangiaceae bacterium]
MRSSPHPAYGKYAPNPSLVARDALLQTTLDPLTRMVLVNAVYLQLPWESPFGEAAPDAFTRADGSTVTANYVAASQEPAAYADDGQAQIVALPLDGLLSAIIALPHADVPLATYEAGLTPVPSDARRWRHRRHPVHRAHRRPDRLDVVAVRR